MSLQTLPAADRDALTRGVAALAWTDAARTRLGWQVRLPDTPDPWTPSPGIDPDLTDLIRRQALDRALEHSANLLVRRHGATLTWIDADDGHLATTAMVAPSRLAAAARSIGLNIGDATVLVSPGEPVVLGASTSLRRLAAEINTAHLLASAADYHFGWQPTPRTVHVPVPRTAVDLTSTHAGDPA